MNCVDSSGWLEFFGGGENASLFQEPISVVEELIVPTVSIYEVYKRVLQQRGEDMAGRAVAMMLEGQVVDLDVSIAISAARISTVHKLPLADSIILATCRAYDATLWTQDIDFKDLPRVRYIEKK